MNDSSDRLSFRPGRAVREDHLLQKLFIVEFGEAVVGAVHRNEDITDGGNIVLLGLSYCNHG